MGHVYIAHGDLTAVAADAWLLPTDASLHVTTGWWTDALTPHLLRQGCWSSRQARAQPPPFFLDDDCRVAPVDLDGAAAPQPWLCAIG
ncbi:MAG: hypothetical protein KC620_25285, partial [Myxococcales bacterium]|nr:hypothetical protein [Myxococcales bacterium]